MRFETTIAVFEREKITRTLDSAATVIGSDGSVEQQIYAREKQTLRFLLATSCSLQQSDRTSSAQQTYFLTHSLCDGCFSSSDHTAPSGKMWKEATFDKFMVL
jgi:hypothetical protein